MCIEQEDSSCWHFIFLKWKKYLKIEEYTFVCKMYKWYMQNSVFKFLFLSWNLPYCIK